MAMMGGLNLGGTCLARHGQGSIFSSKTDQIMSRYRPIAPKPATNPGECNSNSINVNSQTEKRSGPESIPRHTRTRKRTSDSSNGQKRARGSSNPGGLGSERTGDIVADRSRPHIAYSIKGMGALNGNGLMTVEKDSGFMERAAASGVYALNEKESVGLGEVSVNRGKIGSVKRLNAVHMQAMRDPSDMKCSTGTGKSTVFSSVGNMQQEVRPQEVEENGKNPVTLPLLPETSSSKVSSYQEADDEAQLRCFGRDVGQKEDGHYQIGRGDWSPKPTIAVQSGDLSVWDLMYSGSPDPVTLLLDSGSRAVLWSNPAYNRIVKASGSNIEHPHVMNPTYLACFSCKALYPGMVNSSGTLWGFTYPQMITAFKHEFGDSGCSMKRSLDDAITGPEQSPNTIKKGVIMPQPVRPVGSSVSIEYVKDTNLQASPLCKSIDEIEEEIEAEILPALISDTKNRVKRANAAYKEMVGQPVCSWLESTVRHCNRSQGYSNSPISAGNRINGEVVLTNQIPLLATSFSCGVRIQWTNNNGDKSSIRTICDVVKYVACDFKDYAYAWKFHISAAFSLNSRS